MILLHKPASKKTILFSILSIGCFISVGWVSCSSAKTVRSQATAAVPTANANTTASLCSRTVKLHIEKGIVISESGDEKESDNAVELIFNPRDGEMTMTEVKNAKSGKTAMKVESCNLSAGMLSGEAVYTIKNEHQLENGDTVVKTDYIKLEAANGAVNISVYTPGKPGGLKAAVSHWEVMD